MDGFGKDDSSRSADVTAARLGRDGADRRSRSDMDKVRVPVLVCVVQSLMFFSWPRGSRDADG